MTVVAVDCGIKNNQLRCLANRGARLKLVPWDYDFTQEKSQWLCWVAGLSCTAARIVLVRLASSRVDMDGLFLSNGPGDPVMLSVTVSRVRSYLALPSAGPVFGICMGHALLSQAIGASIFKMKLVQVL